MGGRLFLQEHMTHIRLYGVKVEESGVVTVTDVRAEGGPSGRRGVREDLRTRREKGENAHLNGGASCFAIRA